jgi:hypothetical protein
MTRSLTFARPSLHVLIGLCLLSALPVLAGTATVTAGKEGQSMTFEYAGDDLLRMSTSEDTYMLVRDNTLYIVGNEGGEPMVFNASSMMRGFSGMMQQAAPAATTNEFVSLKKAGRSETVAGIRGDVYLLTMREEGKERTEEVVMSDDERAIEFRDALFMMARATMAALDNPESKANSEEMEAQLRDTGMGILRVGEEMTVSRISGEKVAAARFELPAEPMDMQGLGAMMGSMGQGDTGSSNGQEKSGGMFSGMMKALGGQADRQADRASEQVDEEVQEEADNAVDSALDKAFGKFFGRR